MSEESKTCSEPSRRIKEIKKAESFVSKLLSVHPRTVKEIKDKLANKEFGDEIINQVVSHFLDLGYLNDEEYINLWLENQIKYRPSSRAFCFKKLKNLGIDENLIKETLGRAFDEEKEFQVALKIAEDKILELRGLPPKKLMEKLGQFLFRKGFPESVIWKVLENKNLID
jgi:regulatory protein